MVKKAAKKDCGIVMPISSMDGCSEEHWQDVLGIISDAVTSAGFDARLVSEATDVGVIQKRIVQNLYENEIVVCDISGRNPNVMFELGMRLAFDKPVIIIKDDQTPYSFDTSPIEHVEYPRDLRFGTIVEFKEKLTEKIIAVASSDQSDSFLKSFGQFKVAELDVKHASAESVILDELDSIKRELRSQRSEKRTVFPSRIREPNVNARKLSNGRIDVCIRGYSNSPVSRKRLLDALNLKDVRLKTLGSDHFHIEIGEDDYVGSLDSLTESIEKKLEKFYS